MFVFKYLIKKEGEKFILFIIFLTLPIQIIVSKVMYIFAVTYIILNIVKNVH